MNGMKPCCNRQKLLGDIGKVSFAMVELNLYLDTHPYDTKAMESFRQFEQKKKMLCDEYCQNFGPLTLECAANDTVEWKWALQNWPWERGYH